MTLVWGFDDGADPYATAILERMPELQAHVPPLWPLEVANALLVGERRRRITPAETARFLAILATFPITVMTRRWRMSGSIRCICAAQNLSSYDAAYLELALRGGLPLAALDGKLKTAAQAVGVPLFEVA